MYQNHHSIPFSIEGVNSGFTAVYGLAKIEGQSIILEFQSSDAIIGVVKSGLKTVTLPFSAIRKMEFKKGWFTTKITIQTKSMADLKDVPGAKSGSVELSIKKAHRKEAVELNSHFQLEFSEYQLQLLD